MAVGSGVGVAVGVGVLGGVAVGVGSGVGVDGGTGVSVGVGVLGAWVGGSALVVSAVAVGVAAGVVADSPQARPAITATASRLAAIDCLIAFREAVTAFPSDPPQPAVRLVAPPDQAVETKPAGVLAPSIRYTRPSGVDIHSRSGPDRRFLIL